MTSGLKLIIKIRKRKMKTVRIMLASQKKKKSKQIICIILNRGFTQYAVNIVNAFGNFGIKKENKEKRRLD